MRRFLSREATSEALVDQVRRFCDDLERAGHSAEWQVRQAEQALRLYFVDFLERADWSWQPASAVVDEHGGTDGDCVTDARCPSTRTRAYARSAGCPWRNWSKCPHAWHFSYSWRGRHYRFSMSRYLAGEVIGRTEAQAAADRIRIAIRDGTFSIDKAPAGGGPPTGGGGGLTFENYGELFMKGYSKDRGKASWQDDRYLVRRVMDFEVAGHKDLITTQRDMHLSPAALDSAIRLLECSGVRRSCGDIILETGQGDPAIANVCSGNGLPAVARKSLSGPAFAEGYGGQPSPE